MKTLDEVKNSLEEMDKYREPVHEGNYPFKSLDLLKNILIVLILILEKSEGHKSQKAIRNNE